MIIVSIQKAELSVFIVQSRFIIYLLLFIVPCRMILHMVGQ